MGDTKKTKRVMSSSSLHQPFSLFIFTLLLIFSSVAGTFSPELSKAARMKNRARRNKQATEFLHAHNVARAYSGASSLKWNSSLVHFASKWAKQRKSDCKMIHSNGPYGENIFWYKRNHQNWLPKRIVAKWMEESLYYDPTTNTCASGQMCGHYTQIVWRATTAVGCVMTKCDDNRGFLVICEYSPCGNYEGESPFHLPIS